MNIEEHFDRVERWLHGDDERRPADLLRERGFEVKRVAELPDSRVRKELHALIDELASINVYLDATDHLSDRELYEAIVREVLPAKLNIGNGDWAVYDFVADEDGFEACMAYYADDECRAAYAEWTEVPPRRAKPYDRDRKLPRPDDWEFYRVREYAVS